MVDPATATHADPTAEKALITAARGGDRAALETLLRAQLPRIHAVCARMCADRGDADDAAQDALISIARGISTFDGRSALSSWIYRITTNACLDELRRRKRRPAPIDPAELPGNAEPHGSRERPGSRNPPEAAAIAADTRGELVAALSELPEEFRVAVVLRDVADLDYASIAEVTGVAIGTVRSRIARGRGRLADVLGADFPDAAVPRVDPVDPGTESERATSNPSET